MGLERIEQPLSVRSSSEPSEGLVSSVWVCWIPTAAKTPDTTMLKNKIFRPATKAEQATAIMAANKNGSASTSSTLVAVSAKHAPSAKAATGMMHNIVVLTQFDPRLVMY